jgi:AGZA family xanthine/uracil permease-like MFS transporter
MQMELGAVFLPSVLPFVLIFLFMDLFDTMGTLVGVGEQGGFIRGGRLPRASRAFGSDAAGTIVGACLGTSTVTSYIESAAGISEGARTGLANVATAGLFLSALFFVPIIEMVGSYPPITAAALVVVGAGMLRNVKRIAWSDPTEVIPAFAIVIAMPLTFSIGDGIALGLILYPILKLLSGKGRSLHPILLPLAVVLIAYFALLRT